MSILIINYIGDAVIVIKKKKKKDGLYSTGYQELTTTHILISVHSHAKSLLVCVFTHSLVHSAATTCGACAHVSDAVLGPPGETLSYPYEPLASVWNRRQW